MNLIICGDSWSNGAELKLGEKNFGQILAQRLNATLCNQSVDASSIPHLILQLRTALARIDKSQSSVAVFFITSPDRDVIWSDTLPKGSGFMETHPLPHRRLEQIFLNSCDPLHEHWYKTYYSAELANFRANTSLITLQTMCKLHGIQDFYIRGWDRFDLWSEVDVSKFYNQGRSTAFDFFTNRPGQIPNMVFNRTCKYIWPNGSHPNQLGHDLIADKLFQWIEPHVH